MYGKVRNCDGCIPHSLAVGPAQVCFSCAWSLAPR